MLSLIATGTPASGPVSSPASIFACTSLALFNAPSLSTVTKLCTCASRFSIASKAAVTASSTVTSFSFIFSEIVFNQNKSILSNSCCNFCFSCSYSYFFFASIMSSSKPGKNSSPKLAIFLILSIAFITNSEFFISSSNLASSFSFICFCCSNAFLPITGYL